MKKHKLDVISLHDAQAKCSCGWHYVATGERTKAEIREIHKRHVYQDQRRRYNR